MADNPFAQFVDQPTENPFEQFASGAVPEDQIEGTVFNDGLEQPGAGHLEQLTDGTRYAVGSILRGDERSRADMISSLLPDAEFGHDQKGRMVVRGSPDEPYRYINSPGIDLQDVTDFAGEVVKFAPAAKVASIGRGLLARMTIGGAASGATSVASDKAAQSFGSEQDVDLTKAAFATGGGAGGEILSSGVRATVNAVRRALARKAAKRVDDGVSSVVHGTKGANPDAAAREFGIDLTEGQATGRQPQQAFESRARRGGAGDRAQAIMERAATEQTRQVRSAPVLSAEGVTVSNRGFDNVQAGRMIRDGLTRRAADLSDEVDQAYRLAREFDAELTVDALPRLRDTMLAAVDDEVINPSVMNDPSRLAQEYPRATAVIEELRALPERVAQRGQEAGGTLTGIQFRELERYRRSINTAIENSAPRSPDRRALMRIKASFDGYLDEAAMNGLFSGDPGFLDAFKNARSTRTLMGNLFEPKGAKDFARKAVEQIIETDATPEETLNLVFGSSSLGNKRGTQKTIRQLREILGPDSAEYQALREAAIDRIMRKGFVRDELKIGTLIKEWDQALDGPGASVMEEMFSPAEISKMRRFNNVLRRMEPKKGAENYSNTSIELSRMMKSIFGHVPMTGFFSRAVDPNAIRAMQATSGMRPLPRMPSSDTALANVATQKAISAPVQQRSEQQ